MRYIVNWAATNRILLAYRPYVSFSLCGFTLPLTDVASRRDARWNTMVDDCKFIARINRDKTLIYINPPCDVTLISRDEYRATNRVSRRRRYSSSRHGTTATNDVYTEQQYLSGANSLFLIVFTYCARNPCVTFTSDDDEDHVASRRVPTRMLIEDYEDLDPINCDYLSSCIFRVLVARPTNLIGSGHSDAAMRENELYSCR